MACNIPSNADMDKLFELAKSEDWDEFLECLENLKNTKSLFVLSAPSCGCNVHTDEQGTLLHVVCSSCTIQKNVVETLLKMAGPQLLLVQDGLGHTALHDAFRSVLPLEVLQLLTTPTSIRIKDNLCLTPLDHVCERIIMREERHKYYDVKDDDDTDVYLWECARIMLQALGQSSSIQSSQRQQEEETTPMMHACIQASSSCPIALRQRIMKRFAHQLSMKDRDGNVPLHIAAGKRVTEEDEEHVEVINQVLKTYPDAIRVVNQAGNLPLDEAIRVGRTWNNGCCLLFSAFPEAILVSENHQVPPAHLSLVFEALGKRECIDSLYRILHGQPELFRRDDDGNHHQDA